MTSPSPSFSSATPSQPRAAFEHNRGGARFNGGRDRFRAGQRTASNSNSWNENNSSFAPRQSQSTFNNFNNSTPVSQQFFQGLPIHLCNSNYYSFKWLLEFHRSKFSKPCAKTDSQLCSAVQSTAGSSLRKPQLQFKSRSADAGSAGQQFPAGRRIGDVNHRNAAVSFKFSISTDSWKSVVSVPIGRHVFREKIRHLEEVTLSRSQQNMNQGGNFYGNGGAAWWLAMKYLHYLCLNKCFICYLAFSH